MRLWVLAGLLLMVPMAVQADTLTYLGEGSAALPNINSYGGTNPSPTMWDYVYSITDWNPMSNRGWAILCPVVPVNIEASTWSGGGWSGQWVASIPSTIYIDDPRVVGHSGIVWSITNPLGAGANTDYFHFQTDAPYFPGQAAYDGDSWAGQQTEYSANPEPGSLMLMGMAMAGGHFWRRRRNRR